MFPLRKEPEGPTEAKIGFVLKVSPWYVRHPLHLPP
jgi:hypothetical protein